MRSTICITLFLYSVSGLPAQDFVKITTGPVVTELGNSWGGFWCDYDDDGDMDLVVTNGFDAIEKNILYRNLGAAGGYEFEKIELPELGSYRGATWGDFTGDGLPDLFVANHYSNRTTGNDDPVPDLLYKNDGNGNLTLYYDTGVEGVSIGCSSADFDKDGYLDAFVATQFVSGVYDGRDHLYHNHWDGRFTRISSEDLANDLQTTTGSRWGDLDLDGDQDLLVTNETTTCKLYRNESPGQFTTMAGVFAPGRKNTGHGRELTRAFVPVQLACGCFISYQQILIAIQVQVAPARSGRCLKVVG